MLPKREIDNLHNNSDDAFDFLFEHINDIKEDGYIEIYTDKDIVWFTLERGNWIMTKEGSKNESIVNLRDEINKIKKEEICLVGYTITDTNDTPFYTLCRNDEMIVA